MRIVITYLLVLLCFFAKAQMNPPLILESGLSDLNASNYIANFSDITCEQSIDDIIEEWNMGSFMNVRRKSNIGFTQVCHWLQFQIMNADQEDKDIIIEIANPELENITLYIYDENLELVKSVVTGIRYPFIERDIPHRNFLFDLHAQANAFYTVFIRVDKQSNYVNVPVKVWDETHKLEASQFVEYRLGMFYGIMFMYLFVMALVAYFLKDKFYSYYTFLLALALVFIYINEGFAFQYIWPRFGWSQNAIRFLTLNTYMLVSVLFVGSFVQDENIPKAAVRVLRVSVLLLIVVSFLIVASPALPQNFQFWLSIIVSIVVILIHIFIFVVLYLAYVHSKRSSYIGLALAYIVAFGIVISFTLIKFGLIPINIDTSNGIYIGSIIVSILFTVLFVYRIRNVIENNKRLRTELSIAGIKSSFALLSGQEKERIRVADELHDGIGIKMSALKMKLSSIAAQNKESKQFNTQLQAVIEDVDNSCNNIRSLSHTLVPRNLERYGLSAAISDLVDNLNRVGNTKIVYRQKRLAEKIDINSKMAIYRLIEGVLNELVRRKVELVNLKLIIIPSIQQASISFKYIGRRVEFGVNRNLANVRGIIQVLNGQVTWRMGTMWSNELDIDVPVVELELPQKK